MTSVLFVCMGNICRSPSAEGFFRHHVRAAGLLDAFTIDSAGTHGYHVGSPPDHRAIEEAAVHGIDIAGLRARQVDAADFHRFDLIVGMDRGNLSLLRRMAPPGAPARLSLMMEHAPEAGAVEVPDPYYGSQADFAYMCQLLDDATLALLNVLRGPREAG